MRRTIVINGFRRMFTKFCRTTIIFSRHVTSAIHRLEATNCVSSPALLSDSIKLLHISFFPCNAFISHATKKSTILSCFQFLNLSWICRLVVYVVYVIRTYCLGVYIFQCFYDSFPDVNYFHIDHIVNISVKFRFLGVYRITGNFCGNLISAVLCGQLRTAEIKIAEYYVK